MPPIMPEPLAGKEVVIRMFCDADYAGDGANRRSRTRFFVYMNEAPIIWYSKKESRVENSVFGSEFIAMRTGLETVQGLRYKLRMMGIPINELTYIYGDNMSVIYNTSKPKSVLKKKANSVCYHYIRESVAAAADECRTAHIATDENIADIATKPLPHDYKRDKLVGKILHFFTPEQERTLESTNVLSRGLKKLRGKRPDRKRVRWKQDGVTRRCGNKSVFYQIPYCNSLIQHYHALKYLYSVDDVFFYQFFMFISPRFSQSVHTRTYHVPVCKTIITNL